MIRELRTVRENYQDLINGPQRSLTLDIVQWPFCGSSDSIELCTFDGLPIGQAVLQLSRNTGLICKKKKTKKKKPLTVIQMIIVHSMVKILSQ